MSEEQVKGQAMKEAVESVLKTDSIKSHIRNAFQQGWEARKKYDAEIIQQVKDDAYAEGQTVAQTANTEEAYNKGLNEAWDVARKLAYSYDYAENNLAPDCNAIFGRMVWDARAVLKGNTGVEAIRKIREYEARKQAEKEPANPHWQNREANGEHFYMCSECRITAPKAHPWMFCPSCGAKMENGEALPF